MKNISAFNFLGFVLSGFIIIGLFIFTVCCAIDNNLSSPYQKVTLPDGGYINVMMIDGCEYITGNALTHKGNCKNPIHIYNTNVIENISSK